MDNLAAEHIFLAIPPPPMAELDDVGQQFPSRYSDAYAIYTIDSKQDGRREGLFRNPATSRTRLCTRCRSRQQLPSTCMP